MELVGKLFAVLPVETGEGKNGTWRKQSFVIETDGQYPKKVCFALFKDKVELIERRQLGDVVTVKFDAESREYQGRYFTNLNAYSVSGQSSSAPAPQAQTDPLADVLGPLDGDGPAPETPNKQPAEMLPGADEMPF